MSRWARQPGECVACYTERIGCGCDGAYDDGCFLCNPEKHPRPECPPDCYQKAADFVVPR